MNGNKNLDDFFECVEKALAKAKKGVTIFAIIIVIIMFPLFSLVFFGNQVATQTQTYSSIVILICLSVMLFIPYYQLYKKSKFYQRKDFKWFVSNPEDVLDYKIIQSTNDLPSIKLKGKNNTSTFKVAMDLCEVEKRLFKAFPQLDTPVVINNETREHILLSKVRIDKVYLKPLQMNWLIFFVHKDNLKKDFFSKNKFKG